METLARWAGYLAIGGGALVAILVVITAYDPATSAWYAFFLVVALLGAAVLGFQELTKASTGQLGRASAWLSALGGLGLLAVSAYGAWLVLAGAVVGLAFAAVLGENVPSAVYLLFGLFGIGWIVIGYAA